jgi:catechol 2,3-dioxygenase-like lactoylglutathione lyase family enzyme
MINKITHSGVYVLDQQSAFDFYVNKLGFEVRTDAPMGKDVRWLTVGPSDQPDFELILMPIVEGMMHDKETASRLRELVKKGIFGGGVLECEDLNATYEELKGKGVTFLKPPTKEFYKLEAVFKDDSGNWFSLGQRK